MAGNGARDMTWHHLNGRVRSAGTAAIRACSDAARDPAFIFRYISLGAFSTVVNFGVYWVAAELWGMWYVFAAVLAFITRSVFKFLSIRTWLFGDPIPGHVFRHLAQFVALEALFLGSGIALLALLVEAAGLPPFPGLIVSSFVTSVMALILTRYVFKPEP